LNFLPLNGLQIRTLLKLVRWYLSYFILSRNKYKSSYRDWAKAEAACKDGYQDTELFNKILYANLAVKNKEYPYERDSVLFDKIEYSYQLNAHIMSIYLAKGKKISILDFGGSFGTVYRQYASMAGFSTINNWFVIEQAKFCEFGKGYFEDDVLEFYSSDDISFSDLSYDVAVFSAVLEFVERPYEYIDQVANNASCDYMIFDRSLFSDVDRDKLCQLVSSPKTTIARYPCWIFSESKFKDFMAKDWRLVDEWDTLDGTIFSGLQMGIYKGQVWKRKEKT